MHVRASSTVLEEADNKSDEVAIPQIVYLFSTLAIPKSPNFTVPDRVRKMFWERRKEK